MNLTFCNTTTTYEQINEVPLWNGWTFHHLGLWLSAAFSLFATVLSLYLMFRHATHYVRPWEQKHIIRILFMVPVYSLVSFLSYLFYLHSIYFQVIRDCYDAFAIASFFALLCHYVAPDLHAQKEYFRKITPHPWIWPLSWFNKCCGGKRGCARTPRSGLTWFNIIWLCVFQYCFTRVFMTIVAVSTQASGKYCLDSLSPAFAHVWVVCIEGVCVSIAMYCIIQFYLQLRFDLAHHRPFLKVLSIKLVIFLVFWQSIIISFLTSSGVIKESARIETPDVQIGIPAMLICIEMGIFSILHLWAYPWKVYDIRRSTDLHTEAGSALQLDGQAVYKGGPFGVYAFMDAFNPWDLVKSVGRGFKWLFVGRRHREDDISYKAPTQGPNADGTSYNMGKPGKYVPLQDNDSDVNVSIQEPNTHSFSRPFNSPRGDIGTVGAMDRGTEDHLPAHPVPLNYGRPSREDTEYHGAYAADKSHEAYSDPRRGWGQPGNEI